MRGGESPHVISGIILAEVAPPLLPPMVVLTPPHAHVYHVNTYAYHCPSSAFQIPQVRRCAGALVRWCAYALLRHAMHPHGVGDRNAG